MSNKNFEKDIENIKNDISSLMTHLSELKGDSTEVLSNSVDQLRQAISSYKDKGRSKIRSSSFLLKAITCIYGDTFKKTAISMGVAALIIYFLRNEKDH